MAGGSKSGAAGAAANDDEPPMSMDELLARKAEIRARLEEIAMPEKPPAPKRKRPSNGAASDLSQPDALVPYRPKATDAHWDFVMKEMMWLGADFGTERKRQMSSAKRMAASVKQFHKTKEARRQRALANAETKRRRLASKIGRDVKGWWSKVERVVAYKQKLTADEERQVAMNRQLVRLVRQTERYSESLARQEQVEDHTDDDDDSDNDNDGNAAGNGENKRDDQGSAHQNGRNGVNGTNEKDKNRKRRRRKRGQHSLTIEEALAMPDTTSRRSKFRIRDYSRVDLGDEGKEFYGQSIAAVDGTDSDASFSSVSDSDDETTLREAEHDEIMERHRRSAVIMSSMRQNNANFVADPEEIQKLQEEANMPIDDVVKRIENEAEHIAPPLSEEKPSEVGQTPKRVKFAESSKKSTEDAQVKDDSNTNGSHRTSDGSFDNGSDADDDGDASDVEDFVAMETDDAADEEFVVTEVAVDDETTIAQEEALPQEMSTEEEIRLLNEENEMSVEELRKRYANMEESVSDPTESVEENLPQPDEEPPPTNSTSMNGHVRTRRSASKPLDVDSGTNDMDLEEDAEDYQPAGIEVDDETTIEAEERLGRDMSYKDEIALLDEENDMSIEELRKRYYGTSNGQDENGLEDDEGENAESELKSNDDDETEAKAGIPTESTETSELFGAIDDGDNGIRSDDEFEPEIDAVDDETTIAAEERLGREMSAGDEIALLQKESEMSVDDLMKMYSQQNSESDASSSRSFPRKRKRYEDTDSNKTSGDDEDEPSVDQSRTSDAHTSEDHSDDGERAMNALEASAERARNTLATRPYLLAPWVKLREYQQVGLNWLVSLQSRRLNGILADEMGLGKTLQTIAMLSYLASYKGIWGPHLVIVPTSVIINWETELKRFCPALKVLCYYGSAKERKELRVGWTQSNWYHVVITSYQLAVQDAFAFKRKRWYYLILDEAQNIKNFQSQRWQTLISFNTQRRLLLTGTPLQNNLMELWSLLHFLMPYVFRSRKEFAYWFSNPMNNMIEGNTDRNEGVINRLHGIIRPFVLRRLKKDVATQMPGKYEHIVTCHLSRRQMTLYEEYLARSSTRAALKQGGNFMGMMNVLMQLRKVCNHPDLFEPRSVVTPFPMPMLTYRAPKAAFLIDEEYQSWSDEVNDDVVSRKILNFLWCGSSGLPSVASSLAHGKVEHIQLRRLSAVRPMPTVVPNGKSMNGKVKYPNELAELLQKVEAKRHSSASARIRFCNDISVQRCRSAPFPFAENLLDVVHVQCSPFDCSEPIETKGPNVILTPAQLLAARKDVKQRALDADSLVDRFVFCVPKADSSGVGLNVKVSPSRSMRPTATRSLSKMLLEPVESYCRPFHKAQARMSSFFPSKKLIQFDSGKLQTLAELLRNLKQGGHRALIFTQMSKMLDILEAFLNFNGHTYLRLDGSTGVDRRQRYMDRFNNDSKIFCFILSTRSGGLGINLTGADTVIFYDSDWNPAMDAQAQDRAHRIGQTRDVHIYRLVSEHTIEENILLKAKQKRNLDIMVMDQGKFDASQLSKKPDETKNANSDQGGDVSDVYTKGGLRAILGINENSEEDRHNDADTPSGSADVGNMSKEQMETAMATLEDDDDVKALRGAQQEAAEEMKEFDESAEAKDSETRKNSGKAANTVQPASDQAMKQKSQAGKGAPAKEEKSEESEMEKEFAAWQSAVGLDASAIEASLTPMERYGLNFRESIDPFYSVFYMNEYNRRMEIAEGEDNLDVDEIEREKATEESRAMDDGNLLATRPKPEALIRQRNLYRRERVRLKAEKKHRKLTGEDWIRKEDTSSKRLYYYNTDTGEATWQKPTVLAELEADRLAHEEGWHALPAKTLLHIMKFMLPSPDRMRCAAVCRNWRNAATDIRWVLHVYPVEMGGLSRGIDQREVNHYGSIGEALSTALPGDTIELSDGHYWANDDELPVPFPVKLVGDEHNPANVVVETSGTIIWCGRSGWIEGITFRRPKISTGNLPSHSLLTIEEFGRVDTLNCVFDNEGSVGAVIATKGSGKKGVWNGTTIKSGAKDCILNYGDGKVQGRFKGGQKRAPGVKRTSKTTPSSPSRARSKAKSNETKATGDAKEIELAVASVELVSLQSV